MQYVPYDDTSEEIFKYIGAIQLDLLKECIEGDSFEMDESSLRDINYRNYLINNPIVFADPNGGMNSNLSVNIPSGPIEVTGDPESITSIIKRCYNYLIKHPFGLSKEQVLGILCNIYQESAFNYKAKNSIGASGLCQWLGARKNEFIRIMGKDILAASPEEQMAYAVYELTHSEKNAGNKIKASSNVSEACYAWLRYYERPGSYEVEQQRRMAHLSKITQALNS